MPLLSRYRRIAARILPLLAVWVLTIASSWLLILRPDAWGPALSVLALAGVWWLRSRPGATAALPAITLAVGVAVTRYSGTGPLVAGLVSLLLLMALAAPMVDRALRPRIVARRLPGLRQPPLDALTDVVLASTCAGTLALLPVAAGVLPWPLGAAVAGALAVLGVAAAARRVIRSRRHVPEREVRDALTSFGVEYYIHFSGRPEAAYQIAMWLPYLDRTGARGALLVRDRGFLATALQMSTLPVLLVEAVEPLEYLMVPSLGAMFYVNNAAANVDGTRYPQVAHVHLGHGDSDKPPSYAASTAMFDRIFVAGQAGVDRFASHGVLVPVEKFVLVGRPQVEAIQVRAGAERPPERPAVLYAPTYRGTITDMQLSSLSHGEAVVSALLRAGADVIFRPHPFSRRDAASRVQMDRIDALLAADGGTHVTSERASELSIFDCINASDAMVADVSSVVSDYLYSDKPFALAHRSGDRVSAEYPLARAATLLPLDGDITAAVEELLRSDTKAAEREETRRYYLGPWPPDTYSSVFVDAARRAIQEGRGRAAAAPSR